MSTAIEPVNTKTEVVIMESTETALPIAQIVDRCKQVGQLYKAVMKKGEHYGMIAGTKKDTLFKSGAEKLLMMFQLAPRIEKEEEKDLGNGHRENELRIGLYHKHSGTFWGEGIGSCSTMESKYRYRDSKVVCPSCGKPAIIKSQFNNNWLCYGKKGGCGGQYNYDDTQITRQKLGKVENPDIADVYNTVRKMAYKRALVSAVITATGVSDIFTQDLEDNADVSPEPPNNQQTQQGKQQSKTTVNTQPVNKAPKTQKEILIEKITHSQYTEERKNLWEQAKRMKNQKIITEADFKEIRASFSEGGNEK